MAETIYALCAVASAGCAALLFRGYLHTRARLLFWGSICFTGLAVNGLLVFVDLIVVPDIDLALPRGLVALAAVVSLLIGLVWDSQ